MRKIRNIDTHTLFSLSMLAFCLLMLPVLNSKPDVNVDFSQRWLLIGIAQCLIIKLAPLLLHVRIFRKWFGWCDAFSLTQKQWFDSRQTRKFIASLDHDYLQTATGYLKNYLILIILVLLLGEITSYFVSESLIHYAVSQLYPYPAAVALVVSTTMLPAAFRP